MKLNKHGSSPRMRGTHKSRCTASRKMRFIPAYAGNTARLSKPTAMPPVHPRVCGEHDLHREQRNTQVGSSPRMRGTPEVPARNAGGLRFIPAYAGNTITLHNHTYRYAVHPRVCGEHPPPGQLTMGTCGSSPRMRGTHNGDVLLVQQPRFIPAYAGNTARPDCDDGRLPVHPRVCGEHAGSANGATGVHGSSPRMRGTQTIAAFEFLPNRFIPAYAGNTASMCASASS